ncbi:MAG: zinc ribbon domain-containing protein, partial [Chloroflexi bacterium]|nr:zinc ribbon domain-containing protein [Chloroflexota bacterium]
MADALNCPNCGAPLHPQARSPLALCLYCGSSMRLQVEESGSPVVDATLDEKELAALKQLLLDGGREEAVRLYVQMSGADETAARMAVSDLGRQISLDIIRSQNLTPYGVLMVALWTALLLASLAAAGLRRLHPLIALALAAYAGFNLSFFLPALRTSLRYLRAPVARAVTLKLAPVGMARLGGKQVHTL